MERSTLIIENNFNRRELNHDLLYEIMRTTSAEEGTSDLVRNIFFLKGNKKTFGTFYPQDRTIFIHPEAIERSYQQYLKTHYINPYSSAIVSRYNGFFLETCFHELTHVKQYKEGLSNQNDTIHLIIKDCYERDLISDKDTSWFELFLYRFFNRDLLLERNADFNAIYTLLQKDSEAHFLRKEDCIWLKRELLDIALYGYTNKKTPVSRYYSLRRQKDRYRRLPLNENYSVKDKLSWGLPVDIDILAELYYENKQENPNISLILK